MDALLFTLCVFSVFAITGRAWLALFHVNLGHLRSWLASPVLGAAVYTLLILSLNQTGLPVGQFASVLFAVITTISIAILTWRRCWRANHLGPYLGLGVVLFGLYAWPMYHYGFNWLSYGNDDMTNYCLAAQRSLQNGFYKVPTLTELSGSDYSQYFWFMHVAQLFRNGSEMLLAGIAGAVRRPPVEVFMPLIYALALAQIWALGALLCSRPSLRTFSLITCLALTLSPLWNYGTLIQLIAQVGGIGLLLLVLALTARRRFPRSLSGRSRLAAVISLPAASLSVFYPEVIPFFILALLIYTVATVIQRRQFIPGQITMALLSILFLVVLLRHNVLSTTVTLLTQASGGLSSGNLALTIFPYFLVPKGFSFLLGLESIVLPHQEPLGSWTIAVGLALVALAMVASLRRTLRGNPSSCLCTVMALMGASLFFNNNDFGLFKLTMFVTPVFVAELVAVFYHRKWWYLSTSFGFLLVVVWVLIGQIYVSHSTPDQNISIPATADGSISRGGLPNGSKPLITDIASMPVAKLVAAAQQGISTQFVSRFFFQSIAVPSTAFLPHWAWRFTPDSHVPIDAERLISHLRKPPFASEILFGQETWIGPELPIAAHTLVTSELEQLSYNKFHRTKIPPRQLYSQFPLAEIRNRLVFVHTNLSQHYYLGKAGYIGMYGLQKDYYAPRQRLFGIGRRITFQILNPSETVRLRLSLSCSLLGNGETHLPEQGIALGGQPDSTSLGLLGAGSAIVYTPPIKPYELNDRHYVSIDLEALPKRVFRPKKQGLLNLYNRTVSLDPRYILGYCRDISAISEEEYQALPRPHTVDQYPSDLISSRGAEYSGIYEDGWLSKRGFIVLGETKPGQEILIQGNLPLGSPTKSDDNILNLQLNNEKPYNFRITDGGFAVKIPVTSPSVTSRIDFKFSHDIQLPADDARPVSALLRTIKIIPKSQ